MMGAVLLDSLAKYACAKAKPPLFATRESLEEIAEIALGFVEAAPAEVMQRLARKMNSLRSVVSHRAEITKGGDFMRRVNTDEGPTADLAGDVPKTSPMKQNTQAKPKIQVVWLSHIGGDYILMPMMEL